MNTKWYLHIHFVCANDVTELVQNGSYALTVSLADGWYRDSVGTSGCLSEYGFQTKFLRSTYRSGAVTAVVTVVTWAWSNNGFFHFADKKDCEIVDSRMISQYYERVRRTGHRIPGKAPHTAFIAGLTAKIHLPAAESKQ